MSTKHTPDPVKVHPFERSIGDGPYHFVRFVRIIISEIAGAQVIGYCEDVEAGIGTCAHCGTAIMNCYVFSRGDGKKFAVGCDCIGKLNIPFSVKSEAEKARLAHERKLRWARNEKRRARDLDQKQKDLAAFKELWSLSVKVKASWQNQPHPIEYMATQGKTLHDYVIWNIERGNMKSLQRFVSWLQMEKDGEL